MQGECDTSFGEDFRYSVLSEELVVGEIYVRVYNEQPTFVLEVRLTLYPIHWAMIDTLSIGS